MSGDGVQAGRVGMAGDVMLDYYPSNLTLAILYHKATNKFIYLTDFRIKKYIYNQLKNLQLKHSVWITSVNILLNKTISYNIL